MSDDLDRLLNPGSGDQQPGSAVERVPVEGGRVARRQAEKAALAAKKSRKRGKAATDTAVASVATDAGVATVAAVATDAAVAADASTARVTSAEVALLASPPASAGGAPPRKPPRVSVVGVLGELLITAGVVVLMFLGWQIWINDLIVGNEQQNEAQELTQSWTDKGEATAAAPVDRPDPGPPPVPEAPGNAETIANLIIPRFGEDWVRTIRQGVGINDVLNIGIGHYPETQMPGEVGNFAIAGHRTGWGAPLADVVSLEVGDSIYIETEDGWYRYEYRSHEYVMPTGIEVLEAVPQIVGGTATDRIITITSCNPPLTAAERIISYGVYDTWYPRAGGPPPEIAGLVQAAAAG